MANFQRDILVASRVEQLTGLRFVAALGVLLCHFHALAPEMGPNFLFDLGGHGVTLFFVLSGFVLTWRYDPPGEHRPDPTAISAAAEPGLDVRAFARARFARIAPMYWLALVLTGLAYASVGTGVALGPAPSSLPEGLAAGMLNVLALQAWAPSEHVQQFWNAPGWSISAEMFFYACFPWLLRQRWLSGSASSFFAVFAIFSGLLCLYLIALWVSGYWGPLGLAFAARMPLLGLFPFVVGMLCCRWARTRPPILLRGRGWTAMAAMLLLAVAWISDAFAPQEPLLFWLMVSHFLYVPLFALLIVCLTRDTGSIGRALRGTGLVLLGNASYALYLIHWLPLSLALWWLGPTGGAGPWSLVVAVTGLVALSVLLYLGYENPLRLRILRMRTPSAA